MICEIQYQKLIAYAILGYIDSVKRTKVGAKDLNIVFCPLGMIDMLFEGRLDESIISALHQIDEIDFLMEVARQDEFDKSVQSIVDPILLFLSKSSVNLDNGTYAIRQLCCDDR